MRNVLILTYFLFLSGCHHDKSKHTTVLVFKNGEQQLNVNSTNKFGAPIKPVEVILTGNDTVNSGERVKFRMHLNSVEHELLQAYFNCTVNDNTFVDTLTTKIKSCTNRLPVREDSVIIEFKAGVPGPHKFLDLTLISRDKEGVFRYHKSTFEYYAIEKNVR